VRRKLFRREWVFPALAVAFVSASAQAGRDDLSAQAAADMHCNSVTIVQASPTEFLASGCGDDRTYECHDDGSCVWGDPPGPTNAASSQDDPGSDAAGEAVADALTDMACACASAGLAAHGSHHSSSRSRSHGNHAATRTHHRAKQR
jgi:hypothetical protein